MVELNVDREALERVVASSLHAGHRHLYSEDAFGVKVAVQRAQLSELVPELKRLGATDVVVGRIDQIVSESAHDCPEPSFPYRGWRTRRAPFPDAAPSPSGDGVDAPPSPRVSSR